VSLSVVPAMLSFEVPMPGEMPPVADSSRRVLCRIRADERGAEMPMLLGNDRFRRQGLALGIRFGLAFVHV
jgi:hypothetical protein